MNIIEAAGVIPYRHHNGTTEFLIVQHLHGHWEFPKGKIDPGETIQQAALRELMEETGVCADISDAFCETISYSFVDQSNGMCCQKNVHFFIGNVHPQHGVRISDEHAAFQWLSFEHAYAQLTHRESQLLLEKASTFLIE